MESLDLRTLLDVVGLAASLIGIWEFTRRAIFKKSPPRRQNVTMLNTIRQVAAFLFSVREAVFPHRIRRSPSGI